MATWQFLNDWQKKKNPPADMTGGGVTTPKSMTGGGNTSVNYGAQPRAGGASYGTQPRPGGSLNGYTNPAQPISGTPKPYPTGGDLPQQGSFGNMSDMLPEPQGYKPQWQTGTPEQKYQSLYAQYGGETYDPNGQGAGSFVQPAEPIPGTPKPLPTGGDLNPQEFLYNEAQPDVGVPPQQGGTLSGPLGMTPRRGVSFGAQPRAEGLVNGAQPDLSGTEGIVNPGQADLAGAEGTVNPGQPDAGNHAGGWDGWNDFQNVINNSGQYWSEYDLQRAAVDQNFANAMYQAKLDYANATTDEAKALAHANAEALRSGYRYSGGGLGDEYIPFGDGGGQGNPYGDMPQYDPTSAGERPSYDPSGAGDMPRYDPSSAGAMPGYDPSGLGNAPGYDPASAGERPAWDDGSMRGGLDDAMQRVRDISGQPYDDPYAQRIAQQLESILGRDPFRYDYESDPVWQAYKKEYTREGRRASQDALANAALMTGGVPSSYANTAAQQAGNYYAAQLGDKIPGLFRDAYGRWMDEGNTMMDNMNLLRGLSNEDYARWGDDFGRAMDVMNAERGLYNDAYGRHRDDVGDWENDRTFGYNQYLDALSQWNRDRDFGYGQYRDSVGDWRDSRNFDYDRYRDSVGDWRDSRNFDYDRWRDQMGDWRNDRDFGYDQWRDQMNDWRTERGYGDERGDLDYDRRWDEAITAAKYGDYSKLRELGINPDMALLGGGGGYGGGGGNSGGGDQITFDTERGKLFTDTSRDNPELAANYLSEWDNMDSWMRFRMLQNAGVDPAVAQRLSTGGTLDDVRAIFEQMDKPAPDNPLPAPDSGSSGGRITDISQLSQKARNVYDTIMNNAIYGGGVDDMMAYAYNEIKKRNLSPEETDYILSILGF